MAKSSLHSVSVFMRLNNGTDAQGNVKTIGISLGSLNPATYDPDKVLAIVDKVENCLTKTVVYVQEFKTSTITNDQYSYIP